MLKEIGVKEALDRYMNGEDVKVLIPSPDDPENWEELGIHEGVIQLYILHLENHILTDTKCVINTHSLLTNTQKMCIIVI